MSNPPRQAQPDEGLAPDLIRGLAVSLLLLMAGCSPASNEYSGLLEGEKFGPKQKFTGIWNLHQEYSGFVFCPLDEDWQFAYCKQVALNERGCWLELPYKAAERMLNGRKVEESDSFVVTFEGRETAERGQYGHVGHYSCGVVSEELLAIEPVDLFELPSSLKSD